MSEKANPQIPEINPGDTVSVHVRIREGDRERIQEFRGTVIRLRKGGNMANFTVRRTASHGVGVERTFLLRSPLIEKIEVQRKSRVRQRAAVLPARSHGQARPARREAQGLAGRPRRCSAAGPAPSSFPPWPHPSSA